MDEEERLKRIEAMTTLSLIASLYAAGEQHRRDAWKRKLKDALWPLI